MSSKTFDKKFLNYHTATTDGVQMEYSVENLNHNSNNFSFKQHRHFSSNLIFRIVEDKLSKFELEKDACDFFDSFGIMIQCLLLVLTIIVLLGNFLIFLVIYFFINLNIALIVKKSRDPIPRSWRTWFLDVSKLFVSQGTQHGINLIVAYKIGKKSGLECEWYIVNLIVDALIGVLFQYLYLDCIISILRGTSHEFESGNYYINGKFTWGEYFFQMTIWFSIVVLSKLTSLGIILILFNVFQTFGIWLLAPFKGKPKLKLVWVMIILPMIFNTLQFWITDNFIARNTVSIDEEPNLTKDQLDKLSTYTKNTNKSNNSAEENNKKEKNEENSELLKENQNKSGDKETKVE